MPPPSVDRDVFARRLTRVYNAWKDGTAEFGKMDAMAVAVGVDEDTIYSKSNAIQTWLFGDELPDTIMVFCETGVYFLISKKKVDFMKALEVKDENGLPPVHLLVRDKSDKDKANFDKLFEALKGSKGGKSIGTFTKDKFPGEFMEAWQSAFSKEEFEKMDISSSIGFVMSVKEESELETMKKAFVVTSDIFTKYLKDQLMEIVDADKKVRHAELAEGVKSASSDKKYIVSTTVDTRQIDMCYPPIIQSGGNYSLKFSAVSDKNNIHFGPIFVCFGARYKNYCSNICRTVLVNPTEKQQENYNFLCQAEEELYKLLVPGAKLSDVYEKVVEFVKKEKPNLVDKLIRDFGLVTGLEFREESLSIAPECSAIVANGMTFNANIGFQDLENERASDDNKRYALFIGDTVVVNQDGPAVPLAPTKKKLKYVGIFLNDDKAREVDQLDESARARLASQKNGKETETVRESNVSYKNTGEIVDALLLQLLERTKLIDDREKAVEATRKEVEERTKEVREREEKIRQNADVLREISESMKCDRDAFELEKRRLLENEKALQIEIICLKQRIEKLEGKKVTRKDAHPNEEKRNSYY